MSLPTDLTARRRRADCAAGLRRRPRPRGRQPPTTSYDDRVGARRRGRGRRAGRRCRRPGRRGRRLPRPGATGTHAVGREQRARRAAPLERPGGPRRRPGPAVGDRRRPGRRAWRRCGAAATSTRASSPSSPATATRSSARVLGASFPTLTPVPGGWLVEDARGAIRLSPSGDRVGDLRHRARQRRRDGGRHRGPDRRGLAAAARRQAGPVAGARADRRSSARYVTADAAASSPPPAPGRAGRLGSPRPTTAGTGSSRWRAAQPSRPASAVVAGTGDHVAVALLGDDPDGSIPVLGVQVSHDAGRHLDAGPGTRHRRWRPGAEHVVARGRSRRHGLPDHRVAPPGAHRRRRGRHPDPAVGVRHGVFASGDGVCVVVERGRYDALACSSDGLTEWADQPLPGLG